MTERLLLDSRGAAELLSMSLRSVERLSASGELASVRVRGLRRFRVSDLAAFVARLGDDADALVASRGRNGADRELQVPIGASRRVRAGHGRA